MAKNREELQSDLEEILGSRNVYYQPPASIKLKYPCILYELGGIHVTKASNAPYLKGRNYTVTLIHSDPDNDIVDKLTEYPYTSFDRSFIADGLYHYVFEIFI